MNPHSPKEKLTMSDRFIALQAGLWIPVVEIWMRKRGFQRCQLGLKKIADLLPKRKHVQSLGNAQHITFLVDNGNKHYSIYPADCLTRSLVLQYFLRRHNMASTLHLGVRTITGQFEAHAWVEYEDEALGEEMPVRQIYTPFDWTRKQPGKSTP